jgi:acyl-CoA thioester hydrolase
VYSPLGGASQTLYARASTTVVMVDAKTLKPRRISDVERAAWEPFVEDPIEFSRR